MDKQNIADFLFEIASLRRLIRAHSQVIDQADDNIADHSFRVAVMGMILATIEPCDSNKVLKMCLFHDVVETRIGDANFVNQQYVELHEQEARRDQMKGLPIENEVLGLMEEFEQGKTLEAIVAKDADLLDQMILQQEYFYNDEKNRNIWHSHTEARLKTKEAKKLAAEIKKANPFEWVYRMAENKTGEKVDR